MDYKKATVVTRIFLSIALAATAAMPASAGTSFRFICEYADAFGFEAQQHFMLDAERGHVGGDGIQYEPEGDWRKPIIWFEVGGTTVIVSGDDTTTFIAAFDADTGASMAPWEPPDGLNRGTCRVGTE